MEQITFYALIAAAGIAALGWLWLLAGAFKQSRPWGIFTLLFPPLALVFIPVHWARGKGPVFVFLLAGLLACGGLVLAQYERSQASRRSHEITDDTPGAGQGVHLILTKQKGVDYAAKLQGRRDLVGLQMANPEVNDDTLQLLVGMDKLKELDLNDTGITDRGLEVVGKLPALEELRLRKTAITDDGFRKYMMDHPRLKKLELTGTKVKGATKRKWKEVAGRELLD